MRRFFVGLAITAMLGVVPCQARESDRQISQTIVKSLQAEQKAGNLKGFDIDLEVENGAVYLRGTVVNEDQETLALDIARRVENVRQVYNELSIKQPAERAAKPVSQILKVSGSVSSEAPTTASSAKLSSDSSEQESVVSEKASREESRQVAARIIERLKQEKAAGRLKSFSLDVQVDDGVATLSGKVATPEQQNLILDIVRRVPDVRNVVNSLTITRATNSPATIAQQVISSLQQKKASGELRDFSVDVEVDQGIVWLTGHAANEQQQQLILDTARYVTGVSKVVNDISIPGRSTPHTQSTASISKRSSGVTAAQATSQATLTTSPMSPPEPLPLQDSPIGSAVAGGQSQSSQSKASSAPSQNSSSRNGIQYVWVPANKAAAANAQTPLAFAPARAANYADAAPISGEPIPINASVPGTGIAPARFDHPQLPQYAWPSYAPYPNYGAVTYPQQYSPMAWPYIGPFYPYPQVPLGWRKVELKWKDGWWQLDFKDRH